MRRWAGQPPFPPPCTTPSSLNGSADAFDTKSFISRPSTTDEGVIAVKLAPTPALLVTHLTDPTQHEAGACDTRKSPYLSTASSAPVSGDWQRPGRTPIGNQILPRASGVGVIEASADTATIGLGRVVGGINRYWTAVADLLLCCFQPRCYAAPWFSGGLAFPTARNMGTLSLCSSDSRCASLTAAAAHHAGSPDAQLQFHTTHPSHLHGLENYPMEGSRRSSIRPPWTGDRAAHSAHYCSAVCRWSLR